MESWYIYRNLVLIFQEVKNNKTKQSIDGCIERESFPIKDS